MNAGFDAGPCASPSLKQNLDAKRYTGRWYEIWKDATIPFEIGCSCTTATYSLMSNGNVGVQNRCYYWPLSAFSFNINGAA